ncbi:hypothetical protein [uncultured Paraglaciecola sp.]|uniref:hypothetical protein n=1 Tax=uncultured Paraglaciecola sp. TaxID=1765024 RepID=UPI002611EA1D|nr:hypothetical protein [uncultured Paraglaciecola sp.]
MIAAMNRADILKTLIDRNGCVSVSQYADRLGVARQRLNDWVRTNRASSTKTVTELMLADSLTTNKDEQQ